MEFNNYKRFEELINELAKAEPMSDEELTLIAEIIMAISGDKIKKLGGFFKEPEETPDDYLALKKEDVKRWN